MSSLPIDPLVPRVVDRLKAKGSLVLVAPPGAGKTTRVPPALLDAVSGEVVVLQPRRMAARLAARWVAAEMGEAVGERVGYQVRFEDRTGPDTRLRFVTEALLLRRMLSSPDLDGIGAVVFDEFHERHLHTDVALALACELQRSTRPDLLLLVMSATMDAEPVASHLGCDILTSEGRRFQVEIDTLDLPDPRPLAAQVASAVGRLVRGGLDGDVLVFLPGAAEIRRAREACAGLAEKHDLLVRPLYGDLSPAQQDAAVRPADRRKVILSTNVAETSVTIDGVVAVIDSGLARIPAHDPWSGLPTLETRPICRASAAQRAGRAGRTRAGTCLRLYTRHDHDTRRAHEKPELERLDLAETVLLLATLGKEAATLAWLDPPPEPSLRASRALLVRLGALDAGGRITDEGRRMARLPLHPRQARVVLEAERRDCGRAGCAVAALLSERELRREREASESGPSDLLAALDLLDTCERSGFAGRECRALGIDAVAARRVARVRDQLSRLRRLGDDIAGDCNAALCAAVLAGYPDRVANRRVAGKPELVLALGGSARLSRESVVRDADWLVAVAAEKPGQNGVPRVRLASAIEPDWLLDLFPESVKDSDQVIWNEAGERVERLSRVSYEALVLDESRRHDVDPELASELLRQQALAAGPEAFVDAGGLRALRARVELVRAQGVEVVLDVGQALADLCVGRRSFAELRQADLLGQLRASLPELGRLAPEQVTLASGRRLRVHYEIDRPPWVESYLQDFFGLTVAPRLAGGRVPLTLHLLAPNRRAVQVTTDLESFWRTHYPALRKSLSRRYPKHHWPEDPVAARPLPPGSRRRRRGVG
jgi:ATP-dependent helicase HrpB